MAACPLRHCTACREWLPLAVFPVSRGRRSRRCLGCLAGAERLSPEFRRAVERAAGVKRCRRCGRDFPLDAFPVRGGRHGQARSNRCADCAGWSRLAPRQRASRQTPETRERRLAELRRYGLVDPTPPDPAGARGRSDE